MRLVANENIPLAAVRLLRQAGHDVLYVKEDFQGADDTTVVRLARAEGRLLITQDKDFGELAYRSRVPAPCGIVLFRLSGSGPEEDAQRIVSVLTGGNEWPGHFTVVTSRHVRMRPLPAHRT